MRSATIDLQVLPAPSPDYSFFLQPARVNVLPGESGTSTCVTTAVSGFAESVTLSATSADADQIVLSPSTTAASGTSTLSFHIPANAPPIVHLQVAATSTATLVGHQATLTVAVAHISAYGLTAQPSSLTVDQGASTSALLSVTLGFGQHDAYLSVADGGGVVAGF
ncbi:MAG: hypothetical protein JST92_03365 [Deltaproteobacteria bacterium]|nr:hypothetical protein [Deltaproteobacteria bacterium]